MHEGEARLRTQNRSSRRRPAGGPVGGRPDRIALWAFAMAVVVMIAAAASAHAGNGGISAGGSGSKAGDGRYSQLWDSVRQRDKRWARRTSRCESGGDPNAVSGGG